MPGLESTEARSVDRLQGPHVIDPYVVGEATPRGAVLPRELPAAVGVLRLEGSRGVSDPASAAPDFAPGPVGKGRSRPGCVSSLSGHRDPRTRRLHDTVLVPPPVVHPSRTAPRDCHDRRTFFPEQEGAMPLIKPRTRGKQLLKHRTRLDSENNETLYAYAHFLGE